MGIQIPFWYLDDFKKQTFNNTTALNHSNTRLVRYSDSRCILNLFILIQACRHPYKNRYCNLFPFDTNLVTLNQESSYINASWIQLPGASNRFIAAMGPMHPTSYNNKLQPDSGGADDTVPDFWQLCWQTKAKVIVMLCTLQTGIKLD